VLLKSLFIFRLLLSFLIIAAFESESKDRVLKIGINERPFFSEKGKKDKWTGMDPELMALILEHANLPYLYQEQPWKRTLHNLRTGKTDLAFAAGKTPAREKYATFSKFPFRLGHNMLYTKADFEHTFKNVTQLKSFKDANLRIGVVRGNSYSNEYESLIKKHWFKNKLLVVDHANRLPQLLLKNRIDLYIDSQYAGLNRIRNQNINDVQAASFITNDEQARTYLIFSNQSMPTQLIQKINDSMQALFESGEYQALIDKYDGNKP